MWNFWSYKIRWKRSYGVDRMDVSGFLIQVPLCIKVEEQY